MTDATGAARRPPALRRPPVPWAVMASHLDDAAFLWIQWERGLWASDLALPDVEEGDERRLLAHLDALVLGGSAVAARLLLPALEGGEPELLGPVAWALLEVGDNDRREQVLARLAHVDGDGAAALLRAVELSWREDLAPELLRLLPRLLPAGQAGLLAALRFRRIDASAALATLPLGEDDVVRAEAVRAARSMPTPSAQEIVRRGLADASPRVRDAALEAGLVLGVRDAWANCTRRVEAREGGRVALLALAVGGGPRELEVLISALDAPERRAEVLWALGFSGRLQAAEAALRLLRQEGEPLAAGCFAAITGLPSGVPFWADAREVLSGAGDTSHPEQPRDSPCIHGWTSSDPRRPAAAPRRALQASPLRATRSAAATAVPAEPPTSRPSSWSSRFTIAKLSSSETCSAAYTTRASKFSGAVRAPLPSS